MAIVPRKVSTGIFVLGAAALALSGLLAGACRQERWMPLRHQACTAIAESLVVPPVVRAWALNGKGLALYETGQFAEAIVAFEAAIREQPSSPHLYNNLANVHRVRGEPARAQEEYGRAIAADPQYGRAYLNRGMLRFVAGDFRKALPDLDTAVRLQPQASSPLTVRGNIKLAMGDAGGAVADQTAAIALTPDYPLPYGNRGCARLLGGAIDEARADFLRAIALSAQTSDLVPDPDRETVGSAPHDRNLLQFMLRLTEPAAGAPARDAAPAKFALVARRMQEVTCGAIQHAPAPVPLAQQAFGWRRP